VSSTSEEEEALTEKFLKINCKYITDGKVRHLLTTQVKSKAGITSSKNTHKWQMEEGA